MDETDNIRTGSKFLDTIEAHTQPVRPLMYSTPVPVITLPVISLKRYSITSVTTYSGYLFTRRPNLDLSPDSYYHEDESHSALTYQQRKANRACNC